MGITNAQKIVVEDQCREIAGMLEKGIPLARILIKYKLTMNQWKSRHRRVRQIRCGVVFPSVEVRQQRKLADYEIMEALRKCKPRRKA